MVSDTYMTGKLYNKLNAYAVLKRKECDGAMVYIGSSNQFKTQRSYRKWLNNQKHLQHLTIKIEKE